MIVPTRCILVALLALIPVSYAGEVSLSDTVTVVSEPVKSSTGDAIGLGDDVALPTAASANHDIATVTVTDIDPVLYNKAGGCTIKTSEGM